MWPSRHSPQPSETKNFWSPIPFSKIISILMNSDNHWEHVNLQKYVTTLLLQGPNTLQFSSPVLHMAVNGMVWSLLSTPWNGQAALYLFREHFLCWKHVRTHTCTHTHTVCVSEMNTKCLVVCVQRFPSLKTFTPHLCQQVGSNLTTTTATHAFQTINYLTFSWSYERGMTFRCTLYSLATTTTTTTTTARATTTPPTPYMFLKSVL